jgi:iron complex outermembrane receptor protein
MMISSFSNTNDYLPADVNSIWPELREFVLASTPAFLRQAISDKLPTVLSQRIPGIFQSVNPEAKDESDAFNPVDPSFVQDIKPASEMTLTTYELGFKGMLSRKILAGLDIYHNRIKNFIGPLKVETPNVFVDTDKLQQVLYDEMLANGVSELDASFIAPLVAQNIGELPIGLISPREVRNGTDVIITNRNIGDVSVTGLDLSLTYNVTKNWNLIGNYSFVNQDYFASDDGQRDIALNAPKHKVGAIINYNHPAGNFSTNLRVRLVDSFPVNSGIFTGEVERYSVFDLNTNYKLPFSRSTNLTLTVQNLMNNKHKEFVGVPEIGRLAWFRLTQIL